MMQAVRQDRFPTALCTIYYYSRFSEQAWQRMAVTALTVFKEVIIREAVKAGVPLIDLRLIRDAEADDANLIEPSVVGGPKIASVISALGRKLYQDADIQRSLPIRISKPGRGAWAHPLFHGGDLLERKATLLCPRVPLPAECERLLGPSR
jgi:hypothetical protein